MADPSQTYARGPGPGRPRKVGQETPTYLRPVGDISESAAEAFLAEADLHRLMPYSVCRAGYADLARLETFADKRPDTVAPDGVEKVEAECRNRFSADLISWARELLATFLTDADALRAVLAIRTIHKKDGDDIDVCCTASFIQTLYGSSGAKAAEAAIGITDLASRRSRKRPTLKAMGFRSAARLLTPTVGLGILLRARSIAAAPVARLAAVATGGATIVVAVLGFRHCAREPSTSPRSSADGTWPSQVATPTALPKSAAVAPIQPSSPRITISATPSPRLDSSATAATPHASTALRRPSACGPVPDIVSCTVGAYGCIPAEVSFCKDSAGEVLKCACPNPDDENRGTILPTTTDCATASLCWRHEQH